MGTFVKVASLSDLAPGTSRMVEAEGKEVALYNVDGKIFASTNICPHQGGPLAEGVLEGTTIVCPWHAWAFDLTSGTSPVNPRLKIETYAVKVENDGIYVNVSKDLGS
ncbi:MAG: Rieske (2Fe-2S) protein [Planctomycetes bacterium]|nr:Rieske (2Fe-2S) protein [Planctomycetota bacterium]